MADKILHKDFKRVLEASQFSILVFGRQCGVRKKCGPGAKTLGPCKMQNAHTYKVSGRVTGVGLRAGVR